MISLLNLILLICSTTVTVFATPSVIIIGAGPSGIAAATRLLENNFTNIKILEAEPRIGGRIRSVKLNNSFVDLGAEWCDGQKGNLVYEMVQDMNLLEPTRLAEDIYLSSKKKVESGFAAELLAIFNSFQTPPANVRDDERDQSLGMYCQENYPKIIHAKYTDNPEKLKVAKNAMNLLKSYTLLNRGGFSWFDPALMSDHKSAEGDHTLNWKGNGYKIFLDVLMRKYPNSDEKFPIDDKLLLNKEVTKIDWKIGNDKNKINVFCSDNSTYSADHVIFTASVGVLKDRCHALFSPRLPAKKERAIKDIGFGAVIKVVMYYSEDWWMDSPGFYFLWTDNDKYSILQEFPEGPRKDGQSWITSMYRVFRQDRNPNVLIASFVGEFVPDIEVLPEDLLVKGIHFVMEKFLSRDYNVTKPDKILRTNWFSNPHFKGSYAFQTVNSRRKNKQTTAEEDLAEPLKNSAGKPVIQFAGEATNLFHYATVQGAVETGYREAELLLNLYK